MVGFDSAIPSFKYQKHIDCRFTWKLLLLAFLTICRCLR